MAFARAFGVAAPLQPLGTNRRRSPINSNAGKRCLSSNAETQGEKLARKQGYCNWLPITCQQTSPDASDRPRQGGNLPCHSLFDVFFERRQRLLADLLLRICHVKSSYLLHLAPLVSIGVEEVNGLPLQL